MMKNIISILFLFCLSACADNAAGKAPFADLTISSKFTQILAPDGRAWEVSFEKPTDSTFTGVVRHVSQWHDSSMPFMTHDILVTTGDYASKGTVDAFVVNHKFIYHYKNDPPSGSIHLLHIFPASDEIYKQLLEVRDWNRVSISGREIQKIDKFNPKGETTGYFTDMGCNSILVKSVTVHADGTPVP
ncbi:MAG: hypothetical protein IH586_13535 [Anaerolineaceae bacterium]|nr:hypothetical protein [Anaerolineaceae bacterium]